MKKSIREQLPKEVLEKYEQEIALQKDEDVKFFLESMLQLSFDELKTLKRALELEIGDDFP